MYQAKKTPRSQFVPIRNLNYHVLVWGEPAPGKVPLVMVHGWMDVAASFQFVVDAFAQDRYIVAPDWRGFGLTETPPTDNFWFPDYYADLDFLLDHFSPDAPVDLVGHSMGGTISMMYGGSRPARIRRLVNMEGFGMAANQPSQAPRRYARWMDELKALHRGDTTLTVYASAEAVAQRLMKTNKRLSQDKADWLARQWARPDAQGRWHILGNPAHKIVNAQIYRVEEVLETYKCITAPTLAVLASDDNLTPWWQGAYTLDDYHQRLRNVPNCRSTTVADSGHMLHHDRPQELARLIEEFLASP